MTNEVERAYRNYQRQRTKEKIDDNGWEWLIKQTRLVEGLKIDKWKLQNENETLRLENEKLNENAQEEKEKTPKIKTNKIKRVNIENLGTKDNETETYVYTLEKQIGELKSEIHGLESVNASLLTDKYKKETTPKEVELNPGGDEKEFRKILEKIVLMPQHSEISQIKNEVIKVLSGKKSN